jgi:hypothetical protein
MKKGLYASIVFLSLIILSSCNEKCVVCTATNPNKTEVARDTICGKDFNRGNSVGRFEINFKDYNPRCIDAS